MTTLGTQIDVEVSIRAGCATVTISGDLDLVAVRPFEALVAGIVRVPGVAWYLGPASAALLRVLDLAGVGPLRDASLN